MIGTFYSDKFVGRHTASGEIFDQNKPTAAHKSIKLGTWIRVTNTKNGQQVIVKVNDRCPKGGVIDLSRSAAQSIGIRGTAPVTVEILPSEEYALQLIENQQATVLLGILPPQPEPLSNTPSDPPAPKPKTQKKTDQAVPSVTTTSPKKTDKSVPLHTKSTRYNILLGHASTMEEAHKQVERIPFIYHDYIQLTPDHRRGGVLIVYNHPLSRQQAQETRKALNKVFPKSTITQIKR